VLLCGCFAESAGSLSGLATASLICAAVLALGGGSIGARSPAAAVEALPHSLDTPTVSAALLAAAALAAWLGLRRWTQSPPAESPSAAPASPWANSASSGLGAALLPDDAAASQEDVWQSRLPPGPLSMSINQPEEPQPQPEPRLSPARATAASNATEPAPAPAPQAVAEAQRIETRARCATRCHIHGLLANR